VRGRRVSKRPHKLTDNSYKPPLGLVEALDGGASRCGPHILFIRFTDLISPPATPPAACRTAQQVIYFGLNG
jgi:hypothetical protein